MAKGAEDKKMDLTQYLKDLKRASKSDDIPGSVEAYLEELCPNCGKKLKLYKKCCGNPNGYVGCNCGYKVIASGGSNGSTGQPVLPGGAIAGNS